MQRGTAEVRAGNAGSPHRQWSGGAPGMRACLLGNPGGGVCLQGRARGGRCLQWSLGHAGGHIQPGWVGHALSEQRPATPARAPSL